MYEILESRRKIIAHYVCIKMIFLKKNLHITTKNKSNTRPQRYSTREKIQINFHLMPICITRIF